MVDPLVVDAMLHVLRKHNVSKFNCAEYQLEIYEVPQTMEVPKNAIIVEPSDPDEGLYDHLSIKPTFPDKQ